MAVDRKVPRLFAFPPEVELRTLQGVGLSLEEEDVLRRVLLSFCAIARVKVSSAEVLEPIVVGCHHESVVVRSASLHRLVVLSHYFEDAAVALEALCKSSDTTLRVLALTHAANGPPRLLVRVIGDALGAQEPDVRRAAVRLGHGLPSRRCQRLLNRRLEEEPDAGIRQLIRDAIGVQTTKNRPSEG